MERFLSKGLMFTKSLSYVNINTSSYHIFTPLGTEIAQSASSLSLITAHEVGVLNVQRCIIDNFENRGIIGSLNNYDKKIGAGVLSQPECRDIIKSDCSILAEDSIKSSLEDFNKKSVSFDVATPRSSDTSYDGTNQ